MTTLKGTVRRVPLPGQPHLFISWDGTSFSVQCARCLAEVRRTGTVDGTYDEADLNAGRYFVLRHKQCAEGAGNGGN